MGLLQKLPRLESCCCCIELRTGAIILGVLGVISNVVNSCKTFIYVANPDLLEEELRDIKFEPEEVEHIMAVVKPILVFSFISSLATVLISLFLLVGAIQRNKTLLAIYLYINLFCVAVVIVVGILALLIVPAFAIVLALMLAISLYYLFCVNSYYLLLEEEQNRTQPAYYHTNKV